MPTNFQQANLGPEVDQKLFNQALILTAIQRENLELPIIQELISKGVINFDQVLSFSEPLSSSEETNLGSEAIQRLILTKHLTLKEALSLEKEQRFNLEAKVTRLISFINHGLISIDEAKEFSEKQIINFVKVKNLFSLMKENFITIDKVLSLTDQERFNLNCKKIRKFIVEKKLGLKDALKLTENQRKNLRSRNVEKLLKNNFITLEELLKISDDKSTHLSSNRLYDLISEGLITTERAFKLPKVKISDLTSVTALWKKRSDNPNKIHHRAPIPSHHRDFFDTVLKIIRKGYITSEQFFQLDYSQMKDLLRWNVKGTKVLVVNSKIIFDENGHPTAWPNLTHYQEKNLICKRVSTLILNGILPYETALELTNNNRIALTGLDEEDILERLRNGEKFTDFGEYKETDEENKETDYGAYDETDDETTNYEIDEETDEEIDENYQNDFINNEQSTHTTSVHQSVSESAIRLYKRYENQMDLFLEKISDIKKKLENLTDNDKKRVALRCFARLINLESSFTDPNSKISTKQLMALFDLALFDETNLLFTNEASKEEAYNSALKIWVDTLNEIQRGYNQNKFEDDKYICASGTFNKFIEKLCGIHTDCQITFLTLQTASLKFFALMKEEAIKLYLLKYDPEKFTEEFDWQKKIFSSILDLVKEKIFVEFRHLFSTEKNPEGNPEHPDLLAIINQMEYILIHKSDIEDYIKNNNIKNLSNNTSNNVSFFSNEYNNEASCSNSPRFKY